MKQLLLVILLTIITGKFVSAQDYLNGKLLDSKGTETSVLYDRTQLTISGSVFQSVYKVFQSNRKLVYTLTATHDKSKSLIFLALKTEGAGSKGFTVKYDADESGLIFNDQSNTDTVCNVYTAYRYLFSFADANLDYPVLHRIKTDDDNVLLLDPVSRIRLKMHKEAVKQLDITSPKKEAPKSIAYKLNSSDPLCNQVFEQKVLLYKNNVALSDSIGKVRALLQKEVMNRFKTNKVFADERKYSGEQKGGTPNGSGLLIENGNIYFGTFKAGKFVSGKVAIKYNAYEYIGEYASGYPNGFGWVKYTNGSYLMGNFVNGIMRNGISLAKDKSAETFFGTFADNQRSGYGELRNANGNLYFGDFVNGKLVKGITKEVDQFGYAGYFKIENGIKSSIDQQLAEEFFDAVFVASN
ncbi:MAG: hypothetical protein KIS94_07655 [Chitinophagales bacterium]|nr:hypothetical protein [Chitinophagales bacterium]